MKVICPTVVAACAAGATAFHVPTSTFSGTALKASTASASSPLTMETQAFSKSVPFLKKPSNLEGLPGNSEFDPFGLATYFPAKWMQEAELKNGRVAMLAVVGWVVSEAIHLPGDLYQADNPVDAPLRVGLGPLLQIIAFCGFLEFKFHKGKITIEDMHDDPNTKPGEFGFDPLGVTKDKAKYDRYKLSEVKNGRLAMMAIGGLVAQSIVTGHGVPLN